MARISRRDFVTAIAGAGLLSPLIDRLAVPLGAAQAIPRRPFGRTGVEVTIVGLGGGSRFYQPNTDDEVAAELVRQAINGGIGLVETSANYGPNGESERRIGLAMKTHRSKVFLETKVDARDYDGAMREMERSLQRMNTNHLDLVLHHALPSLEVLDQVLSEKGAERAIRRMVDQKVVRFHGFSCHSPAVTLEGIKRIEPHAIQLLLNATRVPDFEPDVLPLARERGIAVIAMKTCGHGYFLPTNATKPDRIDQFGPPPTAFERKNLPTPREYLHYALSLPIATAVVGLDVLSTMKSVIQNAIEFRPLGAAERQAITARAQVFSTTGYWVPRERRTTS
jgi:aryl-alcohol dehydrogenase-like predicted oxidoreductase